ncbi:hypothetical protein E1B28_005406 [Marasmius oreades]|uniref:Uncharacterized protein n=1 Tax=Marasmius oreades TaxID=181124 RepID=A0A9P7UW46_9AGAR|nr:uncharacterized protein E1B28_005406 [Marasmius oreades]KAG7094579.1 hypothetical protein E1B28_005406 [Marasmius oreades]
MSVHLHRLSTDNAWLISFSNNLQARLSPGDITLTFLLDPWLDGPEIDIHPWFLTQFHSASKPPQFHNFPSLAEFLASDPRGAVDAVIITFEGNDHLHKPTIDGVDEDIPFFAFSGAAKKLRAWGRRYIYEIPKDPGCLDVGKQMSEFESKVGSRRADWAARKEFYEKLDINLSFVATSASRWEDLVQDLIRGALVISFSKGSEAERGALLYQPHSTPLKDIAAWKTRQESSHKNVDVFAFLAGWDVVRFPWLLGGPSTNGGGPDNGKIVQLLSSQYWLRTHDEETLMSGLVRLFNRREVWSKERAEAEIPESNTKLLDLDPGEILSIPMQAAEPA